MTIAENLKRIRKERGFTQVQLAGAAGIGGSNTVSNIETGVTQSPDTPTLQRIATALKCDLSDLLKGSEPAEPAPELHVFRDSDVPAERLLEIAMDEGFTTLADARDAAKAMRREASNLKGIDEDFARKFFKLWRMQQKIDAGAAPKLPTAPSSINAEVDAKSNLRQITGSSRPPVAGKPPKGKR